MIPGICPTTRNKCDFYHEWCVNAGNGVSKVPLTEVVSLVVRLANMHACGEIGVDEDGPIEPFCAAMGAAVLFVTEPEQQQF